MLKLKTLIKQINYILASLPPGNTRGLMINFLLCTAVGQPGRSMFQSRPGGWGWALLTGVSQSQSQRASESLCSGLEITDSIRLSLSPHLTSPQP